MKYKVLIIFLFICIAMITLFVFAHISKANFVTKNKLVFCIGKPLCAGKNPNINNIKTIQENGVRPRFSPDDKQIVFDRVNGDGYYDLYLMDLKSNIVTSLSENKIGIDQRSNGNGVFHPSGNFVVFISESSDHYANNNKWLGNPGLGIYSNLWVTTPQGTSYWQLTNTPIKKSLTDGIQSFATVNPLFINDGKELVWTERYAEGGQNNWGMWRLKIADFVVNNGIPILKNERVLFTPQKGNYVTEMGYLGNNRLVVAGNLDGQHEYGMDQYILNIVDGTFTNLTNTPESWEEDSSVTPKGNIIYMSNIDSKFKFDFNKDWVTQPIQRDYYLINANGDNKERLTYYNDPTAPEYLGKNVLSVASDISNGGKYMAATIGVDFGIFTQAMKLKIVLIEFNQPI